MNKKFKETIDEYINAIVTSQNECYRSSNNFYKLYYGVCPTCNNRNKCKSSGGFDGFTLVGYSCEEMVALQDEYNANRAKSAMAITRLRQFVNKYYDDNYLKESNPDLYKIIHDVIHIELNPYNKDYNKEVAEELYSEYPKPLCATGFDCHATFRTTNREEGDK